MRTIELSIESSRIEIHWNLYEKKVEACDRGEGRQMSTLISTMETKVKGNALAAGATNLLAMILNLNFIGRSHKKRE